MNAIDGFWFQVGRNIADLLMALVIFAGIAVVVFSAGLVDVFVRELRRRSRKGS